GDATMAVELTRRSKDFPILNEHAIATETKFNQMRRYYRRPDVATPYLSETSLQEEIKELRYSFPEEHSELVLHRLTELPSIVQRRRERAEWWDKHLAQL